MRKNDNWAYLPDYSSQNHTLKFNRQSRNSYSYHSVKDDSSISPSAFVGALSFAFTLYLLLIIGHDVIL